MKNEGSEHRDIRAMTVSTGPDRRMLLLMTTARICHIASQIRTITAILIYLLFFIYQPLK
jgi:hypothetical protein